MSIIIVEGTDCSGKTYAIEKIAKHFNSGFVLKNSMKPKSILDSEEIKKQYWDILATLKKFTNLNPKALILLDRFYPSQSIYSYLRGSDEMLSDSQIALDFYCSNIGVKLIYLDTNLEVLKKRFLERGDEHVTEEMLEHLRERYNNFLDRTQLPTLKLNTMKYNWLKEVENFIRN